MAWRTICIFALVLLSALPFRGESSPNGELTAAEYGARLDQLIHATGQPSLTGPQTTDILRDLPPVWRVNIENQKFAMSTQWLREDLLNYGDHEDAELLKTDHAKLLSLRADLDGYLKTPPDNSDSKTRVANILSRREFDRIHGPSWLDRLKQRLLLYVIKLLSRAFHSSSIPTIGSYFIYTLVGFAVLALAYWIYRSIRRDAELERIIPDTMAVSAKEWTVWMAEAREAANRGNWREAIHLAYSGRHFFSGTTRNVETRPRAHAARVSTSDAAIERTPFDADGIDTRV